MWKMSAATARSGGVALGGAGPGLGRLDLAVLGRRVGRQRGQQALRDLGDLVHGAWKASSLALEGLVDPLILRTYWSAAASISSWLAGGSKLWSVLMFRHMHRS